eukprot:gene10499-19213_t
MSALNKLADHLGVKWVYEKRCSGFIANYLSEKFQVVLLKPKLAMNINGKSILKAVKTHGVLTDNIILLQDDLDKPVGKLRIKLEGSARVREDVTIMLATGCHGHNGVRSAITSLKTDRLKRYKIGIGRPPDQSQVIEYVLGDFHANERHLVEETLKHCVDSLLDELELKDKLCNDNEEVDAQNCNKQMFFRSETNSLECEKEVTS